jgi:hypothetical protein
VVRINVSRSGVSTSFGTRGLWYTVGRGRRRATLGWPGSGLNYSATSKSPGDAPARPGARLSRWWWVALFIAAAIVWHITGSK